MALSSKKLAHILDRNTDRIKELREDLSLAWTDLQAVQEQKGGDESLLNTYQAEVARLEAKISRLTVQHNGFVRQTSFIVLGGGSGLDENLNF